MNGTQTNQTDNAPPMASSGHSMINVRAVSGLISLKLITKYSSTYPELLWSVPLPLVATFPAKHLQTNSGRALVRVGPTQIFETRNTQTEKQLKIHRLPAGGFSVAMAANRIDIVTLGLTEYITPTLALVLGVFLYKESFETVQLAGLVIMWVGLAISMSAESRKRIAVDLRYRWDAIACFRRMNFW